jgi:hypothetical protein
MVDPVTSNILLAVPTRGSDPGTWDTPLNNNSTEVDGLFGGIQVVAVSNSSFTLTAPAGIVTPTAGPYQSTNAVLRFTGILTANVVITLPLPGYIIVENLTTGNFLLYLSAAINTEIISIEQGALQHVYNDGSRVRFVNLPPVGSYLDISDANVPTWINACSKPPYLNCDGTTFNATTYPYLNAKLGGNTLPDLRGVARYTLNQGTSRLTSAGSGLDGDTRFANKFTQTKTLITANLPPYTPSGSVALNFGSAQYLTLGAGGPAPSIVTTGNGFSPPTPTASFTGSAQGGTSTPFGVIGTGTVSGITLIRAA